MGNCCSPKTEDNKEIAKEENQPKKEDLNNQEQLPEETNAVEVQEKKVEFDEAALEQEKPKIKEEEPIIASKEDYASGALKMINKIRTNPKSFVGDIEQAINKIQMDEKKNKLIYAGKVKVALRDGRNTFEEAIEYLNNLEPMEPLEKDQEIMIKVPDDEALLKDNEHLKKEVEELNSQGGVQINSYFKDAVKDFYTSVLLLIVDDNGKKKGKKREALLNKDYTRIFIDFKKLGKSFCAYYTLAK